jgi:hypothetical protein
MIGPKILMCLPVYTGCMPDHCTAFFTMDVPQNLRDMMVMYHNEGYSWRQIGVMMNKPKSTVSNILQALFSNSFYSK